ncbi:hypothetical protein CFK38_12410 [Brachybacterium vulturis]|uniref:DUF4192 domain-containing protein n=1 Tax=Brachybacterium vulturis TaxID=2017484 RepID=A0A291GPF0_9MICO|nr:hypothetical protein [Brachybacterium vulturis]ATG52239.1 hypothetical protein CFK38_12410 [Brachybacterium vulturis]
MTTDTTPADHGRPRLGVEDPAELLAEARLCLGEPPTDCLLLAGGEGRGSSALITRSPLHDLLGPRGGAHLQRHLALMRERGSGAVRALIVLGDGHQALLAPVVEDILRRAGTLVHEAAQALGDEARTIRSVHGAAGSTCWTLHRVPSRSGGAEVRLTESGPLREFADTRTAATAVLRGHPIPRGEADAARLHEIGRGLELPAVDIASAADPGILFATARAALVPLLAGPGRLSGQDRMTKCEQVAALLSAVAVDRLHWELLAQCVEHGGAREIDRETLLQALVADRDRAPHPDVCAGGEWYVGLERMRSIATAATLEGSPAQRSTARSAWRALTALLVLLAWWNHRFATAGGLVDELREQEPDSTLAPLLSRMTDTPIFPAWWPSA